MHDVSTIETMLPMRSELPKLTDRVQLADGVHVSPFCLGAVDDPDVVAAAYEAGINFFFITADMHWPLYEPVRRGLRDLLRNRPSARDDIAVGVVSYVTQPEFCYVPFEEVLMEMPELQNRIELAIAGGTYGHEFPTRLEIYKGHRETKHVGTRAIGASFHDRKAARAALEDKVLDIAYVRFNPVHPGALGEVFPHVADGQPLLYNFKSTGGLLSEKEYKDHGIGDDYWRPHPTDYYRFAISHAALDGLLIALPAPGAVRELVDAMAKGPLDDDDRQYLLDLGELARGKARLATS